MKPTAFISGLALAAALAVTPAFAEDAVTVGMILPMTGPSASTGKQERAGAVAPRAAHAIRQHGGDRFAPVLVPAGAAARARCV